MLTGLNIFYCLQSQDTTFQELWSSLSQQKANARVLKKILKDKDLQIDELKAKFDSGESEAALRSKNQDLFKELERIKAEHEQ